MIDERRLTTEEKALKINLTSDINFEHLFLIVITAIICLYILLQSGSYSGGSYHFARLRKSRVIPEKKSCL